MRSLYRERKKRLKIPTGGSLFRKDVKSEVYLILIYIYELLSSIHNTYNKYLEGVGVVAIY